MSSSLVSTIGRRLGFGFAQELAPTVRYNMYTELWGAMAYGLFFATALQFVPVVLRRMGATSDLLALYAAQTYLGSILTSFSVVLMRRRRTKNFAVWCWIGARSMMLLFALVNQVTWVLVVLAFFWMLETFPAPAYTRIVQGIYPERVRGKVMSVVRLGMVLAILLVTPLAGWGLDLVGHRVMFPLAAVAGLLSTWFFSRLNVDEGALPPRQTRSLADLWSVIRRNRAFAIHLGGFSVFGIGALLGFALYPIVQVDRLHLSYTQIGLLAVAQSCTWLLGFLFWGRVVDQYGGLSVLRANLIVAAIVPLSYIWATEGWMLLPAFMAQGIVSAGMDLGAINTCIQLAEPENLVEYAAIQSTVLGIRGMIAPFIGAAMLTAGISDTMIFATGAGLMLLSWLIFVQIKVPLTQEQMREKRRRLRFRWPVRYRFPRM